MDFQHFEAKSACYVCFFNLGVLTKATPPLPLDLPQQSHSWRLQSLLLATRNSDLWQYLEEPRFPGVGFLYLLKFLSFSSVVGYKVYEVCICDFLREVNKWMKCLPKLRWKNFHATEHERLSSEASWNIGVCFTWSVLSIGPGTCRSSGGYSVESRRVYLTFKNSPERNSRGLLILFRRVLFQGSHLHVLQILLKALLDSREIKVQILLTVHCMSCVFQRTFTVYCSRKTELQNWQGWGSCGNQQVLLCGLLN